MLSTVNEGLMFALGCVIVSVGITGNGELFEDLERYRSLVRKLNYLTITQLSQLDVAFPYKYGTVVAVWKVVV